MRPLTSSAVVLIVSASGAAAESRQLDAHVHGVGQLDIAIEGAQVAMEFHAPGADIVGFEYAAKSAEDRGKISAAIATLGQPLALFTLPDAAGCVVVEATAALESEELHEDDHEGHDHDEDHDHDDHAENAEADDHDDHEKAEHDHDHEEHDHAEHEDEAEHTEFHAEYLLDCSAPEKLTSIRFGYFETFQNALELEVQVVTDKGAQAFEVLREAPAVDLGDLM